MNKEQKHFYIAYSICHTFHFLCIKIMAVKLEAIYILYPHIVRKDRYDITSVKHNCIMIFLHFANAYFICRRANDMIKNCSHVWKNMLKNILLHIGFQLLSIYQQRKLHIHVGNSVKYSCYQFFATFNTDFDLTCF